MSVHSVSKDAEADVSGGALAMTHGGGETVAAFLESLDAVALSSMSALEKKTRLVNHAMQQIGMGRYGWSIFFLCGYGYLLDLMWAQLLGLIAGPAQQEFGFPDSEFGTVFTTFAVGLTVGALTWGLLGDLVGRRWAFNLTILITGVFGLGLGFAPNWAALCTLACFTGFGIGGNIPIDSSIVAEFLPQDKKYLLTALSLFQPLGVVVCSVLAWALIPSHSCAPALPSCAATAPGEACCTREANKGWRDTTNAIAAISLAGFFLRFVLFRFRESPKFLLSKGRDEEAVDVVRHIAEVNGKRCSLTILDLLALDDSDTCSDSDSDSACSSTPLDDGDKPPRALLLVAHARRLRAFFADAYMARLTVSVWFIYVFDYAAFSIAGSFLPDILRRKEVAAGQSTATTYRNYVIIYAPGIVAVVLSALIIRVRALGKKWSMTLSAGLMAVSLFLFTHIDSPAANVGFNAMEYFFQSMFNAILYAYTPQAFPAPVRSSAAGIASTWGRLASIAAPLAAARLLARAPAGDGVLCLAGGAALLAALGTLALPRRLRNDAM